MSIGSGKMTDIKQVKPAAGEHDISEKAVKSMTTAQQKVSSSDRQPFILKIMPKKAAILQNKSGFITCCLSV
jgi:hypothetical protein